MSSQGLLSLRLSDHFALVVGCINNNWLNVEELLSYTSKWWTWIRRPTAVINSSLGFLPMHLGFQSRQRKWTGMVFYPHFVIDNCPFDIFELIKTSWVQRTDRSLLTKCIQGATQNRDKLWCGMLREYVPKASFDVIMLSTCVLHWPHKAQLWHWPVQHCPGEDRQRACKWWRHKT